MININNLSIQYGEKHLFKNISARINPRDRIGLVGVNGAGKSTLLRIMAGVTETDAGIVSIAKQARVGYLPQEISGIDSKLTLYQEASSAFSELLAQKEQLERINSELAGMSASDSRINPLIQEQGELQHRLDESGIYTMDTEISKVLAGLGFKEADRNKTCATFSGGWLMRLMLAKQLLAAPSFLFLDEPTNHLDIETLRWLEDFLAGFKGGLIIVSHDRAFLDNMTSATWEISLGRLNIYKGNYSKYVVEKQQRLEIQRASYDNQQTQIKQTKQFIERFRSKSTKAKQAQSRIKQLEKMELIEIEETEHQISFQFPPAATSGKIALTVENLTKSYGSKPVLTGLDFCLNRGDKMAVVGVNGAGKSTMVKIMAGLTRADHGTVRTGHNIKISYFGQHQAQELHPDYTVLETLTMIEAEKTITQTRSLLGAFLFRGDEVDKKVSVLSGGEKSRLALARMIATPANLLVLDEPTNHLDMMSQEILQEAMAQYNGTIIIVSHNRFFLDQFVNQVLEIKDGKANLYEGNISDYLAKQEEMNISVQSQESRQAEPEPDKQPNRGKKARQEQARLRQQINKLTRPLRKDIEEAEQNIDRMEKRKAELETLLADPELYQRQDEFAEMSREYGSLERKLERIMSRWEDDQEKLAAIEAEHGATV